MENRMGNLGLISGIIGVSTVFFGFILKKYRRKRKK
jgi:hypothetical protein